MDVMSDTAFHNKLFATLDKIADSHRPLLITRSNGKPAVLMSLEDFHAHAETAYLLASPNNAARLLQSLDEARNGKTLSYALLEDE